MDTSSNIESTVEIYKYGNNHFLSQNPENAVIYLNNAKKGPKNNGVKLIWVVAIILIILIILIIFDFVIYNSSNYKF